MPVNSIYWRVFNLGKIWILLLKSALPYLSGNFTYLGRKQVVKSDEFSFGRGLLISSKLNNKGICN